MPAAIARQRGFGWPSRRSWYTKYVGVQKPTLTAREYDILKSIGRSLTVRQTARTLGIAVKTVENTQGHLFRKLGVHNRVEALTAAYSLRLLQPGSTQ